MIFSESLADIGIVYHVHKRVCCFCLILFEDAASIIVYDETGPGEDGDEEVDDWSDEEGEDEELG